MAIDDVRIRARQRLEELIGVDEAAYVISDRPAGGWDALVTKEHLGLALDAFRGDIEKELRLQTWRFATALLLTISVMTAILRVT